MKFLKSIIAVAAICLPVSGAAANDIVAEGNFARVDGQNGGEVGIGYGFTFGLISLTPIVGAFVHEEDDADIYGKLEGTVSVIGLANVGGGVRVSDDDTHPYGTVSFPILPLISIKGSLWDDYYSAGLTVRF